jgi:hypothetical protein
MKSIFLEDCALQFSVYIFSFSCVCVSDLQRDWELTTSSSVVAIWLWRLISAVACRCCPMMEDVARAETGNCLAFEDMSQYYEVSFGQMTQETSCWRAPDRLLWIRFLRQSAGSKSLLSSASCWTMLVRALGSTGGLPRCVIVLINSDGSHRNQYAIIDDGQTSASQGSLDTSHHPVTKQFIHAESNFFDSPLVKAGQQHKQSA